MKFFAFILAAGSSLVLATGCRDRIVRPEFTDYELDTVVQCGAVPCNVLIRFTGIANTAGHEALRAIETANLNYAFEREAFDGTLREAVAAYVDGIRRDYSCDLAPVRNMQYEITLDVSARLSDTVTVFEIDRYTYTGGAHGLRTRTFHNYRTANGSEISLSDLFDDAQRLRLTERIAAKIREQYAADDDASLGRLGFFPEAIAPTENFEWTPEGIVFHYNPYDIAAYVIGAVEVPFAWAEFDAR